MRSAYRRTAAIAGATALVGVAGVGTAAATPAATTSAPAGTRTASAALVTWGYLWSRLTLSVTGGRTLTVVGKLTRAATGDPAIPRAVKLYVRTADTGRWR